MSAGITARIDKLTIDETIGNHPLRAQKVKGKVTGETTDKITREELKKSTVMSPVKPPPANVWKKEENGMESSMCIYIYITANAPQLCKPNPSVTEETPPLTVQTKPLSQRE